MLKDFAAWCPSHLLLYVSKFEELHGVVESDPKLSALTYRFSKRSSWSLAMLNTDGRSCVFYSAVAPKTGI